MFKLPGRCGLCLDALVLIHSLGILAIGKPAVGQVVRGTMQCQSQAAWHITYQ